jgi:hypothetical protein
MSNRKLTPLQLELIRIASIDDIVNAAFQMHIDEREALRQAIVDLYKYNKILEQSMSRVEAKIDEVLKAARQLHFG